MNQSASQHEKGRRVVVTGLGAVSPLGNDVPSLWEALVEGRSGTDFITSFDTAVYDTKFAAEVRDFDPSLYAGRKQVQRMDRFTQFALAASLQAVESAKLTIDADNSLDTGIILGNSVAGLLSVCEQYRVLLDRGPSRVSPILAPTMIGDAAPVQVTLTLGIKGLNYTVSSACTSSSDAIGQAFDLIRQGYARVMLAGGTEAPIMPLVLAAFGQIRALSTRNDDPRTACRPFDGARDGFVFGEGAAVLVLEDAAYAERRGAPILAELLSYGGTSDAFHLIQPSPGGEGAVRALEIALERAGRRPGDIDYINAHGTATVLNDRTETTAIKKVFGERAKRIPVSATKSMHGHLLGAAGGLEAVITVLAMQHGIAPPTINLTTPDPECDLDYVPNKSRPVQIRNAVSNSFGFGGHNSVLVFGRYE